MHLVNRLIIAGLAWAITILPAVRMTPAAQLDMGRYIPISEIKSGMVGYCLTVLEGSKIERFELKVLSIVKNASPGRDMILVHVTDPAFKDLGSVHGCSGSPVYIENRLAGAMAAGWDGSIKALSLVRPIEDMLSISEKTGSSRDKPALPISPSMLAEPIQLEKLTQSILSTLASQYPLNSELTLTTSLPEQTCQLIRSPFETLGLKLLSGQTSGQSQDEQIPTSFQPGSVLAVPLCSGDISFAVTGTATEVVDDKVYGFGHDFLGIGEVELPIACGFVHTVVVTNNTSFKFSSPGPILGTLRFDRTAGVIGFVGQQPKMIDLDINVRRFDDPQPRRYQCQLAFERRYTPLVLQAVVAGAALMQGPLPPEHHIRYNGTVVLSDSREINFENISADRSISDLVSELFALSAILLNNPFEPMDIRSINVEVELYPRSIQAGIWSVNLSDTTVEPGCTLTATVALRGWRGEMTRHKIELAIPADIPPGDYPLTVCGPEGYADFLRMTAPQQWTAVDADSLLNILDRVLNLPGDRLYLVMPLPPSGLAIRNLELPDLPPSRINLLADPKRILPYNPYRHWLGQSAGVGLVTQGGINVKLTVEKP